MYKFIGLAMLGVFAMMVIPGGNFDATQSDKLLYGMATMVKSDSLGNEVFQQSIHNDLTDEGEAFILSAIFDDGSAGPATTDGFGAICVSDAAAIEGNSSIEDDTANSFDTNGLNDGSNLTCEEDIDAISISSSIATVGPVTFESGVGGVTNIDVDETINSVGICQMDEDTTAHEGFLDCETGSTGAGKLLAVVSVTATTLGTGETVDITYTFDLSSGSS